MTDNTSTSNTNNRVTKAALEAEVEELREQLAKLVDDTQLNSAQLSSVKRPKVLNLDITPAEKHPEVYAEWTGSLKRYLKRLQVKQPALTEKEFLLEVPDLLEGGWDESWRKWNEQRRSRRTLLRHFSNSSSIRTASNL